MPRSWNGLCWPWTLILSCNCHSHPVACHYFVPPLCHHCVTTVSTVTRNLPMSLGCQSDATRMSLHVTSCFDMARTSCRGCLGCLVVKIGESSERNRQIGSKRLKSVNLGGHRDKQFKSKSGAMQFLPFGSICLRP